LAGASRLTGHLINLSAGGSFFHGESLPAVDSAGSLWFELPGAAGAVAVGVRVAWTRPDLSEGVKGVGLTFERISEEHKALVTKSLSRFQALAENIAWNHLHVDVFDYNIGHRSMAEHGSSFEPLTFVLRIAATILFVGVNGFFVAAEFALIKVRTSRLEAFSAVEGHRVDVARHIHSQLNRYLSACQLGITLASLILGWLAEPAVAELLLAGVEAWGGELSRDDPIVHGVALVIALAVITGLLMILGEQAPKKYALQRPEPTMLFVAYPLRVFETLLRPFISVINELSNRLLRLVGLAEEYSGENIHNVTELKQIVASSARGGEISLRQSQLAKNVFGIMDLEARHILVPRMDVQYLTLQKTFEENMGVLRDSGHSRFPLCRTDLDTVIGIVHARDLIKLLLDRLEQAPDLEKLAREVLFVPDIQPLSGLIISMQTKHNHVAVVVNEYGASVGLVFLEDALEEIVGPLSDEFDEEEIDIEGLEGGSLRLPGGLALPKAVELLGLDVSVDVEPETIAGLVTERLGHLPRRGDTVKLGRFITTVEKVSRRRIISLKLTPDQPPRDEGQ
jgi:CBS domain containing-hemolysin-like protein